MKIGILTYHCVPNFGAQLQAISMAGAIEKAGHEAVVLDYRPEDLELMYTRRVRPAQFTVHQSTAQRMMPLSHLCRNEQELIAEVDRLHLDGIIVGSDAVFKYVPKGKRFNISVRRAASIISDKEQAKLLGLKMFQRPVPSAEELEGNPFWGAFSQKLSHKVPMVALSVSCQSSPFKAMGWGERRKMRSCLKNFRSITARDGWTAEMLKTVGKLQNVDITPDPVFAFNENCPLPLPDRESLLRKYKLPEDYVLLSFRTTKLKDSYIKQLIKALEAKGHTPVALAMPEGLRKIKLKKVIDLPLEPLEWYSLIKYSHGYIGERMHPVIASIHNSIPFYSFDEYGQPAASKTVDIIERCGLENCIYSYKSKAARPTPEEVANAIDSFNLFACSTASAKMQKEFELALASAIQTLSARK